MKIKILDESFTDFEGSCEEYGEWSGQTYHDIKGAVF